MSLSYSWINFGSGTCPDIWGGERGWTVFVLHGCLLPPCDLAFSINAPRIYMAIGCEIQEMKLQCAQMLTKSVTNHNDKVAFVKRGTGTCHMRQWNEIILFYTKQASGCNSPGWSTLDSTWLHVSNHSPSFLNPVSNHFPPFLFLREWMQNKSLMNNYAEIIMFSDFGFYSNFPL